ncbi:putative reverse transcriptase domain-containing protein [Tanacetum coccineum]
MVSGPRWGEISHRAVVRTARRVSHEKRYRLELDVSDDTTQTVIVMFDETATALVGCSAGSLIDIEDESADDHEGGDDSVGSSTLDALTDVQPPRFNRLVRAPSVATPSKPSEPKRTKSLAVMNLHVIEDSNVEASGNSSGYAGKNVADPLSNNNKRKRFPMVSAENNTSGLVPQCSNDVCSHQFRPRSSSNDF